MFRFLPQISAFALGLSGLSVYAQDPSVAPLLEKQSKQLEALTAEVKRLSGLIEAQHKQPSALETPSPETTSTASTSAEKPAEAPVAEAATTSSTHTVAKGETLTSIAKQYKITVGDLQKINKIENDRTLQIGQTVKIPVTPSPAEPSQ